VCAGAWSREQALAEDLRRLAPEWRSAEAPARVESRVVAAFRSHSGLAQAGTRWAPVLTGFSAAAALALVAFLFVRIPEQPKPARRVSPAAVQLAAVEPAAEAEDSPDDFVPVPNAAELENGEEMNLVRVEVPRSALIALGYAVSDDRLLEPISADVMLGADGLVHAVRFLDE